MKNISVRQLILYTTLIISFCSGVIIILYEFLPMYSVNLWLKVLLVLACLILNFFLVKYLLDIFVFRRIKIIYKLIGASKLSNDQKNKIDLGNSSLSTVNEDVLEWAENTQNEIKSLKSLETYRKNYVGNVSHELKTPIFSIQGYLMTLLEGGLYDEAINKSYLKKAIANTDRLQNIVEDLEMISKIESDDHQIDYTNFDVKELTTEVFDDIRRRAKQKNIKLIFKDNNFAKYHVYADREMIRQVLINLVINSIKYGKKDGTTKISFYSLEKQILIELTDNGIGIDEKHHKHLFDRFYRVETSRSRKIGGSGLGLAIVKHIIEAHNQSLNVRSTPNIGSTFGFTLAKGK